MASTRISNETQLNIKWKYMSEIQINTSIRNKTFPDQVGQQVEEKICFSKWKYEQIEQDNIYNLDRVNYTGTAKDINNKVWVNVKYLLIAFMPHIAYMRVLKFYLGAWYVCILVSWCQISILNTNCSI